LGERENQIEQGRKEEKNVIQGSCGLKIAI